MSAQYLADTAVEQELSNMSLNVSGPTVGPLSPASSKGSLSPSLFDDVLELHNFPQTPNADELPVFTIKSLSPGGRSISPIDSDYDLDTQYASPCFSMNVSPDFDSGEDEDEYSNCRTTTSDENFFDDFMTLDEIHEQIGTPKNKNSKNLNLETIFEGVFLETPPKEKRFKRH